MKTRILAQGERGNLRDADVGAASSSRKQHEEASLTGNGPGIGWKIAAARRAQGLTLDQLAEMTGFTKGHLSKVENGLKCPPIDSLSHIAEALGLNISDFFLGAERQEPSPAVSIVRVSERQPVVRGGTEFGYDYESIAFKRTGKHMEPFVFRFPKQVDVDMFFQHQGEEMVFVLTGKVHFEVGSKEQLTRWLLEPGDCAYFDSRLPHRGYAVDGDATALVVISDGQDKTRTRSVGSGVTKAV